MAQSAVMTKQELLPLVKQHAAQQAEKPEGQKKGWDIVQETWDDQMILSAMGRSKKLSGALWAIEWRLGPIVAARAEQEAEGVAAGGADAGEGESEPDNESETPTGWDHVDTSVDENEHAKSDT